MVTQSVLLDEAIRSDIRRELAIAKWKFGNDNWQVLSIEGSWGDTLDDRQTLQYLRDLNRTGSIFSAVLRAIQN